MTSPAQHQTLGLLTGVLLVGALLAAPAAADPALPPVVVGGGGRDGSITVTATSPSIPGESGGGSASPVGSGADGSASPGSFGGGGGPTSPAGSGSGDGSSSLATPSGPTGPALDGYGGAFCANLASADCASSIAGAQPGTSANPAAELAYLNAVGRAVCKLGTAAACPVPGTPAAPVAPGAPPAPPPPPSAAVVAQIAISQLNLTAATPHVSADPNLAVGLPVWLWVGQSPTTTGPVSTTATAGPTSVTAVATVSRIDWSMGPAGAVVSCAGPGTPAPPGPIFHGNNSPDCGYSYALRSLPERTGGMGKWPVTATTVWNITWFGAGQAGGQGLSLTSRTAVEVGELQALFVAPGGGH